MMDRPVRKWERNSITYLLPYFTTAALWTVSTGYGISRLVRIGFWPYRLTTSLMLAPFRKFCRTRAHSPGPSFRWKNTRGRVAGTDRDRSLEGEPKPAPLH